jgi:hypothetical protein
VVDLSIHLGDLGHHRVQRLKCWCVLPHIHVVLVPRLSCMGCSHQQWKELVSDRQTELILSILKSTRCMSSQWPTNPKSPLESTFCLLYVPISLRPLSPTYEMTLSLVALSFLLPLPSRSWLFSVPQWQATISAVHTQSAHVLLSLHKYSLHRGNQVKMKPLGWVLIQYD